MPPGWYQALNEGKEIVAWDARTAPPPAALADADVVLEGFRPGVWERLAVDLPPTAILCSITGFGADGPRARDAGHDLNSRTPPRPSRRCRSRTSQPARRAR